MFKQKLLTAVTVDKVLTRSQCDMIKNDASIIGLEKATVMKRDGSNQRSIARTCSSCWLPKSQNYQWLYNYIASIVDEVNTEHYRFDIMDMQNFQVLRYRPGQWFHWHWDFYDGSDRKMTMVVNLSDSSDYIGGGLQVDGNWSGKENCRNIGAASFFPAWMKHRARAPIWGTRWVLVGWITGPQWK